MSSFAFNMMVGDRATYMGIYVGQQMDILIDAPERNVIPAAKPGQL